MRWGFDLATGYKHPKEASQNMSQTQVDTAVAKGTEGEKTMEEYRMTPEKWMVRIIFLESIAGVPGFVAGIIRHLSSLRNLEREGRWIETLLDEAENERMHLMTFLKISQPGPFMRLMIFLGQGVFFNAFFFSYLLSPATCHRFVGFLEESAVDTYTRCLADIDAGRLPEWDNIKIPDIAHEYWNLSSDATMRDLIMVVRADESNHRHVNHSFANLQRKDRNPFIHKEGEIKNTSPTGIGLDRDQMGF
jgi:ubiquinol oxidase